MNEIPGFTLEQSEVIHAAAKRGLLTPDKKRAILQKVQAASSVPVDPRPPGLSEATGGVLSRSSFEATGGTIGSVLGGGAGAVGGAPAGPPGAVGGSLLGATAGGALGSAIGSTAFDVTEGALDTLGVIKRPEQQRTTVQSAAKAAYDDFIFGGGLQVAGAALGTVKPLIGKVLGVRTQEVGELVQRAKTAGIPVGAVDVVPGPRGTMLRGGSKVFGIFPFIGGPFRKEASGKAAAVIGKISGTLNTLAPTATMASELGLDMSVAAKNSYGQFKTVADGLYSNFRTLAEGAGAIVPTQTLRDFAEEAARRAEAGKIILKNGDEIVSPADAITKYIATFKDLPDNITIQQFERLVGDLESAIGSASASGFDVKQTVQAKKALEAALANLDVSKMPEESGAAIKDAYNAANEFFAKGIATFQTPTAGKFVRTDANLFKAGSVKPGTLNEDEVTRFALNLKSPQAVKDLRSLVGDDLVARAGRSHIESAWDKALLRDDGGVIKGIDWDAFERGVGLSKGAAGNAPKAEREALKEMLSAGGVSLESFENLIEVARNIEVPRDVNQFIARRAALGGLGSAMGGATIAGLVDKSLLASFGVAYFLRHVSKIMASPKELDAMRRVLDPSFDVHLRRALLGRFLESTQQVAIEER